MDNRIKINMLFLTRGELLNSELWKEYFKSNLDFKISIYSDSGYLISDEYFKEFQVIHNSPKDRFKTVLSKYKFLETNVDSSDFYIFLTDDCIPIRPAKDLIEYLSANPDKSFLESEPDPHAGIDDGRQVFSQRNFRFENNLRMKNNDWLCLSNKHAKIIVENYHHCLAFSEFEHGGEHFISSILNMHGEIQNTVPMSMVKECWDGYNGTYPSIFSENDTAKIMDIRDKSGSFFLRKFPNNANGLSQIIK
jgi:hypothetical protein